MKKIKGWEENELHNQNKRIQNELSPTDKKECKECGDGYSKYPCPKCGQPKEPSWSEMKDTDWRKQLHLAMEEVKPADWYYEFIESLLKSERERIEKLIVDEILICHKENTPTSRLTSLAMKIKNINLWKTI